ncbi:hypothetical protein BLNAU_8949 [Blattamonas nauphoetae]|uniref:Uncharacterized protein n=1 Tax=Blattamonas nauphoetae TaxID=2049346 RepID=A0ABQ9XXG5_9EUKA|nr:hypothetical protein BLNAU_8949 [Blattamonas nauphoetae]
MSNFVDQDTDQIVGRETRIFGKRQPRVLKAVEVEEGADGGNDDSVQNSRCCFNELHNSSRHHHPPFTPFHTKSLPQTFITASATVTMLHIHFT